MLRYYPFSEQVNPRPLALWQFVAGVSAVSESSVDNNHFARLATSEYDSFVKVLQRDYRSPREIHNTDYPGIGFEVNNILYNFLPRGSLGEGREFATDDEHPKMVLFALLPDPRTIDVSVVNKIKHSREAVEHKITHVMDQERVSGSPSPGAYYESPKAYYNDPLEYNAYSMEILKTVRYSLKHEWNTKQPSIVKREVCTYLQRARDGAVVSGFSRPFVMNLTEKNYVRLVNRVVNYVDYFWDPKKNQYNVDL